MANVIKEHNWSHLTTPVCNLQEEAGPLLARVKERFEEVRSQLEVRASVTRDCSMMTMYCPDPFVESVKKYYGVDITEWMQEPKFQPLMDHPSYIKWEVHDEELKQAVSKKFNYDPNRLEMLLHVMEPGQMGILHIDRHKGADSPSGKPSVRHLIFFDDWAYGQSFQVGEEFIKWRAGDAFLTDEGGAPHGGANFGFNDRFVLRVTGEVLD